MLILGTVFSCSIRADFPLFVVMKLWFMKGFFMVVKACIFTDAGKKRPVNQDSSLVKVANSSMLGRISFVAVCDGMGGLSRGEVASCKVIRSMENWFHEELTMMQDLDEDRIWKTVEASWNRLLAKVNAEIRRYGKHRGINLGTTLTALLQIGKRYMLLNVGDSRIYLADKKGISQITHDQSLVQDKIDKGILSKNDAVNDSERSVLLQCIGTSGTPKAQFVRGEFKSNTTVVACTDGFWRTMDKKEIFEALCPQMCVTSDDMLEQCKELAMTARDRREHDNITVAALCMEI